MGFLTDPVVTLSIGCSTQARAGCQIEAREFCELYCRSSFAWIPILRWQIESLATAEVSSILALYWLIRGLLMTIDLPKEVSEFAEQLGPSSSAYIAVGGQQEVLQRLEEGLSAKDAVLGSVFCGMLSSTPESHGLLNEFWKHIHSLLRRMSSNGGPVGEECDALQSAVRTILNAGENIYFRTEAEFLSLLSKRTKWKEANQHRKRWPDALDTAGWAGHSVAEPGAATRVAGEEARNQVTSLLMELSGSDRTFVLARLSSSSAGEALDSIGRNNDSGRRALNRAMQKFRHLVDPGAA